MKWISKISFLIFVGVLLLPLIQLKFNLIEEKKLQGEYTLAKEPLFSKSSLKKGEYQTGIENLLKDRIGFRGFLVRLRNQFNYSLLGDVNTYGVSVGKDNMLIPNTYIESYFGLDYVGDDKIDQFTSNLYSIQEGLKNQGINFMVLLAPGKASIYPERIPEDQIPEETSLPTNYNKLIESAASKKINLLDFRAYLLSLKGQTETQIFPNFSVHWSGNTVSLVSDSLIKYINHQFQLNLPSIQRQEGYYTVKDYQYTDYDIGESMNLLWHAAEDSLYYPTIKFIYKDKNAKRPAMLGCGDSFFQSFKGFYPVLDSCFSQDSRLYYYNKLVDWPPRFHNQNLSTSVLDIAIELKRTDIVILEMTEENIKKLGYGFTDELLSHVQSTPLDSFQLEQIRAQMEQADIIEKANVFHKLAGYSFDEMKFAITKKLLSDKVLSNEEYERLIETKINEIYNNPEWLKKVKEQASAKSISLEQNVRENAKWVVDQEYRR